jgi:hypothetical protein
MRRPSPFEFLIGHRLARLIIACWTLYALYLCLQRGDAGLGVIVLLSALLARYARLASGRIAKYRAWKLAFDQMSGAEPASTNPRPSRRRKTLEAAGLVGTWAILGLWLPNSTLDSHSGTYATFAATFGLLTLRGAYVAILPLARRVRGGRKRKGDSGEFIVRVVPPIPKRSPSQGQIFSGLPDYCKDLIAGRTAPR